MKSLEGEIVTHAKGHHWLRLQKYCLVIPMSCTSQPVKVATLSADKLGCIASCDINKNNFFNPAICTNSTQQPSQSDLPWFMVALFIVHLCDDSYTCATTKSIRNKNIKRTKINNKIAALNSPWSYKNAVNFKR